MLVVPPTDVNSSHTQVDGFLPKLKLLLKSMQTLFESSYSPLRWKTMKSFLLRCVGSIVTEELIEKSDNDDYGYEKEV